MTGNRAGGSKEEEEEEEEEQPQQQQLRAGGLYRAYYMSDGPAFEVEGAYSLQRTV